jgi:hypothetical protein
LSAPAVRYAHSPSPLLLEDRHAGRFRYVQRSMRGSGGRLLIPLFFNSRETARYYHRLLAAA